MHGALPHFRSQPRNCILERARHTAPAPSRPTRNLCTSSHCEPSVRALAHLYSLCTPRGGVSPGLFTPSPSPQGEYKPVPFDGLSSMSSRFLFPFPSGTPVNPLGEPRQRAALFPLDRTLLRLPSSGRSFFPFPFSLCSLTRGKRGSCEHSDRLHRTASRPRGPHVGTRR